MHDGNIKVWVQIHLSYQLSSASVACVGRGTAVALGNSTPKSHARGTQELSE